MKVQYSDCYTVTFGSLRPGDVFSFVDGGSNLRGRIFIKLKSERSNGFVSLTDGEYWIERGNSYDERAVARYPNSVLTVQP